MTSFVRSAIHGVGVKFYLLCWLALPIASPSFGQDPTPVQITSNSWTVIADPAHSTIDSSFQPLHALVRNLRSGFKTDSQLKMADGWTIERVVPDQLNIHTSNPESGWAIVASADELRISCTNGTAIGTGDVPISTKRFAARLLDPEGTPVNWVGTKEVQETYGAAEVRNPSFLPRENPEVMYFALGQIASPVFHSLFDQQTDMAIDFPSGTVLAKTGARAGMFSLSMPVPGNAIIRIKADYYTKTLRLPFYAPFDDSYFKSAPMVWSSWTSYYEDVSEKDMVSNTDWIATNLRPYGFQYVELDDGYDRTVNGQHGWIEGWNRAKFPNGPEWLTAHIRDKGLQAGIWLVPNAYAGAVDNHPDWHLHYKTGKIVLDYNTPALDSTHPEVLNFVQKLFTTLDDWGFTYYKFDGEHAVPKIVPNIDLAKLYDPSIDAALAYRNRLQTIRNTIGPKRFIEVCPAGSPLDGIGFINSYFNGHNLYDNWHGMYSLFGSINGSRGSDVDWDTFKHVQSKYYIHNFPEILDLKVNGNLDDYDVIAFTNWRDQPLSERVSLFRKFGLGADDVLLAFDFWNQEFVGIFNSHLDLTIDPHDTRVLLLHKRVGRPQIIGSSRHITGEFSFSGVSWDDGGNSLQGTSEIVSGDPYSFWLYIPVGFRFVKASDDKGRDDGATIQTSLNGSVLKLTLSSAQPLVRWKLELKKATTN